MTSTDAVVPAEAGREGFTLSVPLEGLSDLPPNVLAAVVTFLEMTAAPALPPEDAEILFERLRGPDHHRFREIFLKVGTPWLWTSRLRLPEAEQIARLDAHNIEAFAVVSGGTDIGLVELERDGSAVEVVYFGLVPGATGRGLGRRTMQKTLARAWAQPDIARVWLHTCTLDHHAALAFYQALGFRPYKRGVEVFTDPRATGDLPADAAPHFPRV